VKNVRQFFDDHAKHMNIDPLDVKNWYKMHLGKMLRKKVKPALSPL